MCRCRAATRQDGMGIRRGRHRFRYSRGSPEPDAWARSTVSDSVAHLSPRRDRRETQQLIPPYSAPRPIPGGHATRSHACVGLQHDPMLLDHRASGSDDRPLLGRGTFGSSSWGFTSRYSRHDNVQVADIRPLVVIGRGFEGAAWHGGILPGRSVGERHAGEDDRLIALRSVRQEGLVDRNALRERSIRVEACKA